MTAARFLTHNDRWHRHEKIVAAYQKGASSAAVAEQFGMSQTHVCAILRRHGAVRPWRKQA